VTLKVITRRPENTPVVHFAQSPRLLGSISGELFQLIGGLTCPDSRASSDPDEPTSTARIQALLEHIRALDKSMDEARRNKIENIKRALGAGPIM
jgi:hypothetical protein